MTHFQTLRGANSLHLSVLYHRTSLKQILVALTRSIRLDFEELRELLDSPSEEQRQTPLHTAAKTGNNKAVRWERIWSFSCYPFVARTLLPIGTAV